MNTRALAALLFLALFVIAAPAQAAEQVSEEHVDVSHAVIEVQGDTTEVHLNYTQGLALKLDTFLFGSASLERSLADIVNVRDPEYRSLTTDSATLVIDRRLTGTHEFGQSIERVEIRDQGWRVRYDTSSVYLR